MQDISDVLHRYTHKIDFDMDEKDEIALMFEEELHNLDNFDEEEYDESFEQLEALGFQLKKQLNESNDLDKEKTDDDEWESLMDARKANARFAILEEAVCMHAPSQERKSSASPLSDKKRRKSAETGKTRTSRSPAPASDSSPSSTVPLFYRRQTVDLEPEIIDLMDTICDAVSAYASLSIREDITPRIGPLEVDMSHLPAMFTSESEQAVVVESKDVNQVASFDHTLYAERAAILDETAENEKSKVQAAIDLLQLAEEKLKLEAEEEAAELEKGPPAASITKATNRRGNDQIQAKEGRHNNSKEYTRLVW